MMHASKPCLKARLALCKTALLGTQACGSGGTAAGMAVGLHLSGLRCRLHAMGVCDDPQYFYDYIDGLLKGMGCDNSKTGRHLELLMPQCP